ncbi:PQQ-dependent sugar dehydrogenase [Methylibium rhizosphaerae]|uniref:PQQ-dependent sugar dehydrogenase n=1 Tax=Methylibium rhizosphaerae TaxID=2570323 RepID=UPI00112E4B0F|nr:PQQ-dependent sugar dehydrogenase [Methylibium rhizosphaerae]
MPSTPESSVTRRTALAALSTASFALGFAPTAGAQAAKVATVARGLDHPWGMAFLPSFARDGRVLVTERSGRMRLLDIRNGTGSALEGLPPVDARGQGGLLDVVLHPQFADNAWVYWSYAEPDALGGNSTAVARGRLDGTRLRDVQVVFRQAPKFASTYHFGSRLVFARDGRLFVTLGDRNSRRDDAQVLSNHHGKIVRIEADGSVPRDNPFVGQADARPEIWSLGHRNVQGAALHPATGELWTHEHGPQGGDEVNVAEAGKNYGWPVITYGAEYGSGRKIGEGTHRAGMEQPLTYWVPSIAPSGMAFVTGNRYPGWQASLVVGALRGQLLARLQLEGRKVVRQERLLTGLGERIRDVRQGPDGWLYLLTDSDDGRLLRLDT